MMKFLYNFEQDYEITNNGISLAYSGSIIGNMNSAQNVYAGPSNENYAKVGAVSSGEEIIVLEGEFGWYQIEYETSSGNKVGFVPKSTVPNVNMDDTSVPYNNGGLAFAHSKNIDVYYTSLEKYKNKKCRNGTFLSGFVFYLFLCCIKF